MNRTAVVFRKWDDTGEIIALFPEIPTHTDRVCCQSYIHVGQHSAANYAGVVKRYTLATRIEYVDLLKELEQVGYSLHVVYNATCAHVETRQTCKL